MIGNQFYNTIFAKDCGIWGGVQEISPVIPKNTAVGCAQHADQKSASVGTLNPAFTLPLPPTSAEHTHAHTQHFNLSLTLISNSTPQLLDTVLKT